MGTSSGQTVKQAEQRTRTLLDLKSDMESAHSSWMYEIVMQGCEISFERTKGGTKSIVGGQAERGIVKTFGKKVSSPKNAAAFGLKHQVKDELFDPKKWIFDAMNAQGGSWKFWGRFLEGSAMIFESATPIGRAISAAIYVDDVVSDLLQWEEKRESLALVKQYDLAYLNLTGKISSCKQAIAAAMALCGDVKAHVKSPTLRATFSWAGVAMAAAEYAKRSGVPTQQQGDLAKQAYKLYSVLEKHSQSKSFLDKQQTGVAALHGMCNDLQAQLRKWAADPESIPFGDLPVRVHGVEGSLNWLAARSRGLEGLAGQFVGMRERCSTIYDELLGEIFLVCFALGILANFAQESVKQAERGRRPGVHR